ncbi:hypothetical protein [Clostridium sp. VAP52]|uniref:hypothetical protein n=1 Tax=Clostridium sp. VAP52 TaxID=2949977 RepID=UPI002079EF52|nr:hypothetical protein [Clostridium sp. VAP52]
MKKIEDSLLKDVVEFKVGNLYMYDVKSGIEYATATIKTNELNAKAEQIEVKSGNDNDVTYIIDKPKTLKFTIEDVIQDQNLLALKLGDGLKGADVTVYGFHMPKIYTITSDTSKLIITLDEIPKEGEEITFKNLKTGKEIESSKFKQDTSDKHKFEITEVGLIAGDTVEVGGFKFQGIATDKYFNLTSGSSVPELFSVIEVPLVKDDMSHVCNKQYILPRTKLSADVTQSSSSDPKEATTKHELTVLKPKDSKYLGHVYYKFPTEG